MKKMFTHFTSVFSLVLCCVATISAQTTRNTMTVTSPASIAGDYEVSNGAFGDQTTTQVSGTLAYVDDGDTSGNGEPTSIGSVTDGCQAIVNSISGSIALIDRGVCLFVDKCRNAQTAGAIAVIVCNDAPESDAVRGGLVEMQDSDPPASDITIPCVFATLETCETIKVEIANGINVDIKYVEPLCDPITYAENVIWGAQPGEGDFDGGLNGWTIDSEFGFTWDAEGRIDRGAYNAIRPFIESATVCNGAVVCDSDFLDNGGVAGAFGSGDCPSSAPDGLYCDSRLMSPIIDLSQFDTDGLVLEFTQAVRQFQSQYYIEFSTDGGNSWPDTLQINQELGANDSQNDVVSLPLCGYDGQSQFRFRFWIRAAYYYWGIDDVKILNLGFGDGETIDNFFAVAPNLKTPVSQVEALPFLTSILNNGNKTLSNINLGIEIFNNTSLTSEYTGSNAYGELAGCGRQDNIIFADTYTPSPAAVTGSDVVEYTGTYSLTADNDDTPNNNSKSYKFFYTENTFAKVRTESEVGYNYLEAIAPISSGAPYFSLGNHYHVVNGAGYEALSVRAGLGNDTADDLQGFYIAELYKWVDINENGAVEPNERALIASGQALIFSGTANLRDVEIQLESSLNEDKIALEDNTDYVLMMHTNPNTTGGAQWSILAASVSNSPEYNYFELGIAAANQGAPRYGSFYAIGASADDVEDRVYNQLGGFSTYAPLTIGLITGTEDLNKDLGVSVFPNPAQNDLFLSVSLESALDVQVNIVNLEGKQVLSQKFSNIKEGQLRLDVTELTTGVYMANIRTEDGFTSKRVIIQK